MLKANFFLEKTENELPCVVIRETVVDDIYLGLLDCLNVLSPVPLRLTPTEAIQIYRKRYDAGVRTFSAVLVPQESIEEAIVANRRFVMVHGTRTRIIGTASVFFEPKYLHHGGKVAHIEDVAVCEGFHGKGIGKQLVSHVVRVSEEEGCYKAILNCKDDVVPFYKSLGFYQHEHEMRLDLLTKSQGCVTI